MEEGRREGETEGEGGRREGRRGGGREEGDEGGREGERAINDCTCMCILYSKVEPESFILAVEYKTLSAKIHLKLKEIKRIDMCTSSSPMAIIIHLPNGIYKREIIKLEAKFRINNFWPIKGTLTSSYSVMLYTL